MAQSDAASLYGAKLFVVQSTLHCIILWDALYFVMQSIVLPLRLVRIVRIVRLAYVVLLVRIELLVRIVPEYPKSLVPVTLLYLLLTHAHKYTHTHTHTHKHTQARASVNINI